jgi:hypothetical protein
MKWFVVLLMMVQGQPQTLTVDAGPWATQKQCEQWLDRQALPRLPAPSCAKIGDQ